MKYGFECDCGRTITLDVRAFQPPKAPRCVCGLQTSRVYGCQIDTAGCRDVDDVPAGSRIACGTGAQDLTPGQVTKMERRYAREVASTRRSIADGGNKGNMKMTHQIPAALHAAKIKQTGDRDYWQDPKNRNRHKSCQVD